MLDFPNLTRPPTTISEEPAVDPTIRTPTDSGKVITRSRFTRIPKKWVMAFRQMPESDKVLVSEFQDTVKVGANSFNWLHPKTKVQHTVRILPPAIKFDLETSGFDRYRFNMMLEAV